MTKYILALSLILVTHNLFSQEQFNRIYENETYPYIHNVFPLAEDTGYVSIGGFYINNNMQINVNHYSPTGDHIWSTHYGYADYFTHSGMENGCIKTEGGYVLAGSAHYGNQDTNLIYIAKFDEYFDTLWTRQHFKDTNWVIARGICNTSDGGFMVVGETQIKPDGDIGAGSTFALMLKLDAYGNYEWFKSFGTDGYNDNFYKVVQAHDGGYLVGGSTDSWQDNLDWVE